LGAEGAAVAKKSPSGATVAGGAVGAALPVIAVLTAAKVEVKPGGRLEFKLESLFAFEKPPVNPPQQ